MTWIDTHCHLNDDSFADQLDAVIARALAVGVEYMFVVGYDVVSSQRAIDLADRFDCLRAIVGIQPNYLDRQSDADFVAIEQMILHPKVVAVGETGLDLHWKVAPLELQQDWFDRHLHLARQADLPVVIHCRDAEAQVVEQLQAFAAKNSGSIVGVMHSFAGDATTARSCIDLGMHLSFSGLMTYKKNEPVRAAARITPLDRLLVETDSPYLPPQPVRGKPNEPAHVIHTAAVLASLHGVAVEELAPSTTTNVRRLFTRLG